MNEHPLEYPALSPVEARNRSRFFAFTWIVGVLNGLSLLGGALWLGWGIYLMIDRYWGWMGALMHFYAGGTLLAFQFFTAVVPTFHLWFRSKGVLSRRCRRWILITGFGGLLIVPGFYGVGWLWGQINPPNPSSHGAAGAGQ